jgi:hypothetical protein
MTKLKAIEYLVRHSVYTEERSGVGMWEAVEQVIWYQPKSRLTSKLTKKYLDKLLKEAENSY